LDERVRTDHLIAVDNQMDLNEISSIIDIELNEDVEGAHRSPNKTLKLGKTYNHRASSDKLEECLASKTLEKNQLLKEKNNTRGNESKPKSQSRSFYYSLKTNFSNSGINDLIFKAAHIGSTRKEETRKPKLKAENEVSTRITPGGLSKVHSVAVSKRSLKNNNILLKKANKTIHSQVKSKLQLAGSRRGECEPHLTTKRPQGCKSQTNFRIQSQKVIQKTESELPKSMHTSDLYKMCRNTLSARQSTLKLTTLESLKNISSSHDKKSFLKQLNLSPTIKPSKINDSSTNRPYLIYRSLMKLN